MKTLPILLVLLAISSGDLLQAQSRDYVTGFGFQNRVNNLVKLKGDRWLAICTGNQFPGGLYSDTVVALIFDAQMNQILEKRLPLPVSEVHHVFSVVGMPDGGFAVEVTLDECDAGYEPYLMVFDQNGNQKWSKIGINVPDLLKISPGGKLIGLNKYASGKITTFNADTGAEETIYQLDPNGLSPSIYDLVFLDDNEDKFLAVGYPALQLWLKASPDQFQLIQTKEIPPFIFPTAIVKESVQNQCYVYRKGFSDLFRIDDIWSLNYTLVGDNTYTLQNLMEEGAGFIAIIKNEPSEYQTVRINFDGNVTDTIRTFPPKFQPLFLSGTADTLITAGAIFSGIPSDSSDYRVKSTQLWFNSTLHGNSTVLNTADIQLQKIYNTAPVSINSYASGGSQILYSINGGHFYAEIKNNGAEMIESLDLNIGFELATQWICFFQPAKLKHYSGLQLSPGNSILLDFGDVAAVDQQHYPSSLCFWTSAPNHLPDANPQDDSYCKLATVVDTDEPKGAEWSFLYPNPATNTLHFREETPVQNLSIYDAAGKLAKSVSSDITDNVVDIAALRAGLYIVVYQADGGVKQGKFVKQ